MGAPTLILRAAWVLDMAGAAAVCLVISLLSWPTSLLSTSKYEVGTRLE